MKEEIEKFIKENYKKMSTREIGKCLNLHNTTILRYAKKIGITFSRNKNNIKKSLYKNINNKRFVYFLGFLWADGNLRYYPKTKKPNAVSIETLESDSLHIEKIISKIPIKYSTHKRSRKNRKHQQSIIVSDVEFSNFLKNEFKFDKKSYISHEYILNKIPRNLWVYWMQGYVDGDGFIKGNIKNGKINRGTIQIGSSYDQDWSFLEKIINCNVKIKKYISRKGHKSSTLNITKINDCKKFLNWLYEYPEMCLKRKYEKYTKFYK